jgi:hypothetical protein
LERSLFPKEKNMGRRLYDLNNYLLGTVETFLALEKWQLNKAAQHIATTAALRELLLPDEAAAMLRYTRKRLDHNTSQGMERLVMELALEAETYQLSLQQGRNKASNAQALSDTQDLSFICEKLRTGCLLLSHEAVGNQTFDKGLLEPVLRYVEGHRCLEVPIVAAYYHGYYAQLSADEKHFSRLKSLLEHHAPTFSMAEMHDLYLMAINFCIRRINRHEANYFREIFDLYRSGLQHGALLEGGSLSRWTYNNITSTAIRLGEFDWLRVFLNDYAPLLPEEHREGALNLGLARYYYETGQHPSAMRHLLRVEYDDVLQNLMAKMLLAKIYYELDESDTLENQLDSIQIYLRRKKVLGYHKDNYMANIRFMKRLMALQWNDKKAVAIFRQEIEEAQVLSEREWFLGCLGKQ